MMEKPVREKGKRVAEGRKERQNNKEKMPRPLQKRKSSFLTLLILLQPRLKRRIRRGNNSEDS
jgi:hypothetical protein